MVDILGERREVCASGVKLRSRGRGYFGELPQRGGVGGKFEHVYGICSSLQWKRAS